MNAALDRAADPRELVDYTYVQLQELLAEVRLRRGGDRSQLRAGRNCG